MPIQSIVRRLRARAVHQRNRTQLKRKEPLPALHNRRTTKQRRLAIATRYKDVYYRVSRAGFGSILVTCFMSWMFARRSGKQLSVTQTPNIISRSFRIFSHAFSFPRSVRIKGAKAGKGRLNSIYHPVIRRACKRLGWKRLWKMSRQFFHLRPNTTRRVVKLNRREFQVNRFDIGLHIRRGDKRKEKQTRLQPSSVYLRAFQALRRKIPKAVANVYIATDDGRWVRPLINTITRRGDHVFIQGTSRSTRGFQGDKFQRNKNHRKKIKAYDIWVRDLWNLIHCRYVIATGSSNMGVLVELMHPGNRRRNVVRLLDRPYTRW